jgi:hypothetical protein
VAVDEVDHDARVHERKPVERVVAAEPHGRGVHEQVGLAGPLGVLHAELLRELRRPSRRAVPDGHARARAGERPDGGPRRATRAHHERGGRHGLAERVEEPTGVRVVPHDAAPLVEAERVHCTNRAGRVAQLVGDVVRGLLVRNSHVRRSVARARQRADRHVEAVRRHRQRHVPPVEAQLAKGRVHHRGRPAVPGGEPEDARERGQHFVGDLPPRASRARLYSFT